MSMMGTLAKVAMAYAAAKGVAHLAKGGGLPGASGGARINPSDAQAKPIPGTEGIQDMVSQMSGGLGGLQEMFGKMAEQNGFDLNAILGGGAKTGKDGGLLSSAAANSGGIAGILAALGGAAAASGKNMGGMLDQFSNSVPKEAEESAALLLRSMIQAAKADGKIDKAEQEKILETLGDDADDADKKFVRDQLAAKVDIDGLAADTPAGQQAQVYAMSLMSIRVDTQAEAQYLDSLAKALDLNQQTVNALHVQMGVQPLYA